MKLSLLFLLLSSIVEISIAQNQSVDFPRDTTFSVRSAYEGIKKEFPQATPVKEFTNRKIKDERDVVYYSLGNRDLHLDIFYPSQKSKKKLPAVLLIHGGGWASGNKLHLVPMAQKLAENGFFAATAEHRLSPEAKYPAAITDLKTAVKWIKNNAEKYNIDTTKIAVLGCSSGATLASFIGTTGQNPKFKAHPNSGDYSDKVQAIINIDGIVDFTTPSESAKDPDPDKPTSAGARWFGVTYQKDPDIWVEASPLTYANKNTPPTLYINSALPRFHAGREQLIKVLKENNTYYEIHTIENTPHPFWLFHPWFDETWPIVVKFLDKIFQ